MKTSLKLYLVALILFVLLGAVLRTASWLESCYTAALIGAVYVVGSLFGLALSDEAQQDKEGQY